MIFRLIDTINHELKKSALLFLLL